MVIQNIWEMCGESAPTDEIPYWETVNKYLERLDPKELQNVVCRLVYRLMERLNKEFPKLPVCFCADSLYACENFFAGCRDSGWRYILRYKEGSIQTVADEYNRLKKQRRAVGNRNSVADPAGMISLRTLIITAIRQT